MGGPYRRGFFTKHNSGWPTMRPYQYAMHINGSVEYLGFLAFASDDEAVEFGKQVVRDLTQRYSDQYSGAVFDITELGRTVGHVTVD